MMSMIQKRLRTDLTGDIWKMKTKLSEKSMKKRKENGSLSWSIVLTNLIHVLSLKMKKKLL